MQVEKEIADERKKIAKVSIIFSFLPSLWINHPIKLLDNFLDKIKNIMAAPLLIGNFINRPWFNCNIYSHIINYCNFSCQAISDCILMYIFNIQCTLENESFLLGLRGFKSCLVTIYKRDIYSLWSDLDKYCSNFTRKSKKVAMDIISHKLDTS